MKRTLPILLLLTAMLFTGCKEESDGPIIGHDIYLLQNDVLVKVHDRHFEMPVGSDSCDFQLVSYGITRIDVRWQAPGISLDFFPKFKYNSSDLVAYDSIAIPGQYEFAWRKRYMQTVRIYADQTSPQDRTIRFQIQAIGLPELDQADMVVRQYSK